MLYNFWCFTVSNRIRNNAIIGYYFYPAKVIFNSRRSVWKIMQKNVKLIGSGIFWSLYSKSEHFFPEAECKIYSNSETRIVICLAQHQKNIIEWLKYRIISKDSRRNYQFFTFFPAGIIGGRELLEGGNYSTVHQNIIKSQYRGRWQSC